MEKRKRKISWQGRAVCLMLPCLLGTAVFFLFPFVRVIYYSLIDNQVRKDFTGFKNYLETLQNPYFQLAMKNSLVFILLTVPVLLLLALLITFGTEKYFRGKYAWVTTAFLLPMVVPTAAGAQIFRFLFSENETVLPIWLMFLWKNLGICVIFLSAAAKGVDKTTLEAAAVDGAGDGKKFFHIVIPQMMPAVVFSILLSIVNTFRIFKESYLFYGSGYPPNASYTLQYFMNNNFLKLNYQSLSSAAVITAVLIGILAWGMLRWQKHYL